MNEAGILLVSCIVSLVFTVPVFNKFLEKQKSFQFIRVLDLPVSLNSSRKSREFFGIFRFMPVHVFQEIPTA